MEDDSGEAVFIENTPYIHAATVAQSYNISTSISQPQTIRVERVGIFRASFFTYISTATLVSTIIICYAMAVYNGHAIAFLPMISDCGVYSPEKYIFTIGIVCTAVFIFINAGLFYFFLNSGEMGKRQEEDRWALMFAFVSTISLAFVGVANEKENPSLHFTAAIIFFAAHIVYMAISTIRVYRYKNTTTTRIIQRRRVINPLSLWIKLFIIVFSIVNILLAAVLSDLEHSDHTYRLMLAITEWLAVFFIIIYNLSYIFEFGTVEYLGSLLLC